MSHEIKNLRERISASHKNHVEVLALTKQLLEATKSHHGPSSVEYAVVLNDLGGIYRHLGQYPEAEHSFNAALTILGNTIGAKDPNYATALNNLAGLYRLTKAYTKAEQLFLQVIRLYEETLGYQHFLTLSARNNLGLVYQDLQRYDEARKLHEQCLTLLEPQRSEHPLAYTTTLSNLASIYDKTGEKAKALETMAAVLGLYQQHVGNQHQLYANALNNYASLMYQQGNLAEAKTLFEEAVALNHALFGENSEIYKATRINLNIIEKAVSEQQQTQGLGLGLSQRYFESICFPVLQRVFPDDIKRMAFGLVGEGSECWGFDDVISQDHDFGPQVMIWLTDADYARLGERVQKVFAMLPRAFEGFELHESHWGQGRTGVFSIGDFYARYLGLLQPPQTLAQWQRLPEHHLATATNGRVFYDPLGEFTRFREQLLHFYPEDVRLKKMAACCMQIAQSGQYNYARLLKRNERVALHACGTEFIEAGISLIFLLNKRYRPFYKWMHRALKQLPILGHFSFQLFNDFVTAPVEQCPELIETFCAVVINELKRLQLSTVESDFLLDHGPAILQNIQDHTLKHSNPWTA
ncbi:MAG: tetratricopeptide repeat protein [Enterobacteriaceae bacterium]